MSRDRGGFEITTSLDLARAPAKAFDFLADTRSFTAVDAALVEFEPHGRLAIGMTEEIDLEATQTGTRATFVERVWPTTRAGWLLVALSGAIMRRDLRARALCMKALLEGPAAW